MSASDTPRTDALRKANGLLSDFDNLACALERESAAKDAEIARLQALHLERTKSTHAALTAKDATIARLKGVALEFVIAFKHGSHSEWADALERLRAALTQE